MMARQRVSARTLNVSLYEYTLGAKGGTQRRCLRVYARSDDQDTGKG